MSPLPTRQLGRTGLEVTRLGYGARFRRAPSDPEITPQQAETALNAILDAGINYIDTGIDYGHSEVFIGQFISHRRSEYYLATKCGCVAGLPPSSVVPEPHGFSRQNIITGVDQSLARMKTDYIDVIQSHRSLSREVLEENNVIETLLDLKREGKVRFIGISAILPNVVDHIDMGVFDVFQLPYSALQREHEEVISNASQMGAGTVIRGGTGRVAPGEGKESGRPWGLWEQSRLDELLEGITRIEFILRFTLTHPDLDTAIVGTRNLNHLRDNVNAAQKGTLPENIYTEAKRRLSEAGMAPQSI